VLKKESQFRINQNKFQGAFMYTKTDLFFFKNINFDYSGDSNLSERSMKKKLNSASNLFLLNISDISKVI
jgi:hypothetical protein